MNRPLELNASELAELLGKGAKIMSNGDVPVSLAEKVALAGVAFDNALNVEIV